MENKIKILSEKEGYYLAEIKSINSHIKTIKSILKMDLKKFNKKVLNVRFAKAINENMVVNKIILCTMDRAQNFGKKEKYRCQEVVHAVNYRKITIEVATNDENRILLEQTLINFKNEITRLRMKKEGYIFKFKNYDKNILKIKKIAEQIKSLTKKLTYEDREYIKNNFCLSL